MIIPLGSVIIALRVGGFALLVVGILGFLVPGVPGALLLLPALFLLLIAWIIAWVSRREKEQAAERGTE